MDAIGTLAFEFLLFFHWSLSLDFLIAGCPVFASLIAQSVYRVVAINECQSFSSMFLQLSKWVKAFLLLSIGTKLDGHADWEWVGVFWPVWVALCFMSLVSVGIFLLFVGAVSSYCNGETSKEEVISTLWLFYTTGGATIGYSAFFYYLLQVLDGGLELFLACLPPIFYQLTLLLLTKAIFTTLVNWWNTFFINEEANSEMDESLESNPVSNTQRRNQRTPSFSQQLFSAMKRPPKALVRLSSTYFQPAESQVAIKAIKHSRSTSYNEAIAKKEPKPHRRIASSAQAPRISIGELKRNNSDFSFVEKTCVTCCENQCNAVIMECGHGGLCYDCALELWKSTGMCHMCRTEISQVLQIELEPSKVLKVLSTTRAMYYSDRRGDN